MWRLVLVALATTGELQSNRLALFKRGKGLLKNFCAIRRDTFHSQGLRGELNRGIEVTSFRVRDSESIDHMLVLPHHDAAGGLCVFHSLLAVAKRRVRASRPKPGTVGQHSGKCHASRMQRRDTCQSAARPCLV